MHVYVCEIASQRVASEKAIGGGSDTNWPFSSFFHFDLNFDQTAKKAHFARSNSPTANVAHCELTD